MGISQIGVNTSSSPIKSIQRGVATTAGNITISSVDLNKSMVTSFSTGSSGSVGATGTITGTITPTGGWTTGRSNTGGQGGEGIFPTYSGTRTLSAGETNLTSAVNGAYLSNSTTLVVTGPCRWEIVEFN